MRRLAVIGALVVATMVLAARLDAPAQGGASYRVDAIFDTAKGLIPGQTVKIAGARVGTITGVSLTPDYKARIELSVDGRFAPFRADARCEIQPEGLIAENFVNCDPGTQLAPALRGSAGQAPTVPVSHTTVPVSLTDLFNVWSVPVRDRLSVLTAGLGVGLSARGSDLNDVIRRANPSLALTRRAVAILDAQRAQLSELVSASDQVVGDLAARRGDVQGLLDHTARVTAVTAAHRAALGAAVRRLPALLGAARPSLTALTTLTDQGTPVLAALRAATPGVTRTLRDVVPFAAVGTPAVEALSRTVAEARAVVGPALPVIRGLRAYLVGAQGPSQAADALFTSLRDRGFTESFLLFVYRAAAATARYDGTSHIFPAHFLSSACSSYATTPSAACDANWDAAGATRSGRVAAPSRGSAPVARPVIRPVPAPTSAARAAPPVGPAPGAASAATPPPAAAAPGVAVPPASSGGADPVTALANYLLGR